MAEIQFSLIKKIKIGRPKHSLTPHPPTSDNISFLPYHPPPASPPPTHTRLKVDVMCITPKKGEEGVHASLSFDNAASSKSNLRSRTSKRFAFRRKREKIWRNWNCSCNLSFLITTSMFQFVLRTDHLLIIETWCRELNLAIEKFSISKTVDKPKKSNQLILYLLSFFLLHSSLSLV